jgi:hypothetical protein
MSVNTLSTVCPVVTARAIGNSNILRSPLTVLYADFFETQQGQLKRYHSAEVAQV